MRSVYNLWPSVSPHTHVFFGSQEKVTFVLARAVHQSLLSGPGYSTSTLPAIDPSVCRPQATRLFPVNHLSLLWGKASGKGQGAEAAKISPGSSAAANGQHSPGSINMFDHGIPRPTNATLKGLHFRLPELGSEK